MRKPNHDAAVLVFNRTQVALDELVRLCAPIAAMRSMAAAWLAEPSVEFFALISTGGAQPQTGTLGARNLEHLLNTVLPDAMGLIAEESLADSVCTSLDPALKHQLAERWATLTSTRR